MRLEEFLGCPFEKITISTGATFISWDAKKIDKELTPCKAVEEIMDKLEKGGFFNAPKRENPIRR